MVAALFTGAIVCLAACGGQSVEERAREAAEEIKKGAVDPGEAALDQKLDKKTVRQVQEALSARHEYMGEINGVVDAVTVNALQAFQRSVNAGVPWWMPWNKINEIGLLDEPTRIHLFDSPAS